MFYQYINLKVDNNLNSGIKSVEMTEKRQPKLLDLSSGEWECTIDRFYCKRAFLPIYKCNRTLTISVSRNSDNVMFSRDVDFTNFKDSNNFLYFQSGYIQALNNTIVLLGGDFGANFSGVVFSLTSDGRLKLVYPNNWHQAYYLFFNAQLFAEHISLPYVYVSYPVNMPGYQLSLGSTHTIEASEPMRLSPVHTVYITSDGSLPINSEFVTDPNSTSDFNKSDEIIVQDFNYIDSNPYCVVDLNYASQNYRWHTVQNRSGIFNRLNLVFKWRDNDNISYPLYIKPGGYCDVKVSFKNIY